MGTTAASPFLNPIAAELENARPKLTANAVSRRASQRRRMLGVQFVSCLLISVCLLAFVLVGAISITIVSAYFLAGVGFIGIFLALSEAGISDRFEDHYLSVSQVAGHVAVQLGFILVAPQIGYALLSIVFVVFGFGALRMTTRQVTTVWTLTAIGLVVVFLLVQTPVGLPLATQSERFAAVLFFAMTVGQCAFVGLYGSSMRKMLYDRRYELKIAYERIEELADLDELTGSYNRRCIMRLLEEEVARSHRTNTPCSIALIDLDWFKRINDGYGHPTGDEVLRTYAISMFANIRAIDKFGRYGGEEFLLLLPDARQEHAARMLDRLRLIIGGLDWSAFSPGMQVTISAGVAMLQPEESPDALLARADRALYVAKAKGRNRIATASSNSPLDTPMRRRSDPASSRIES
jgi:diguanylate cyclase (GGDEF)-like protein